MALFEQLANGGQQVLVERRVEEHQVVGHRWLGLQIAQGVGGLDLAGGATQRTQMLLEAGHRKAAGVQCLAHGGATGQGFEKQRAAAGERIEHLGARDVGGEPVEQGFPHPVRRRAQARSVREAQLATAPFAANDAQLVHAVMHVAGRFFRMSSH
ncbi:hypothetical protein D3C79_897890 [compost metagenome]